MWIETMNTDGSATKVGLNFSEGCAIYVYQSFIPVRKGQFAVKIAYADEREEVVGYLDDRIRASALVERILHEHADGSRLFSVTDWPFSEPKKVP